MGQLGIDGFDAERYWASREYKKWVVYLSVGSGKKAKTDRILVTARNEERAVICAKKHSLLTGRVFGRASLARPSDLGCRPTGRTE